MRDYRVALVSCGCLLLWIEGIKMEVLCLKKKNTREDKTMASSSSPTFWKPFIFIATISLLVLLLPTGSSAHGHDSAPAPLTYHNGPVLHGQINVAILWYGRFAKQSKSILRGFINSLNKKSSLEPSVNAWWKIVEKYQPGRPGHAKPPIRVRITSQKTDNTYSVGKILTQDFFPPLVEKVTGGSNAYLAIIFTAPDVSVDATCMGRCSRHGTIGTAPRQTPYIIVGNPETECPGDCAVPFHASNYGPQSGPLQPPNGNIGADAMVINLASALAAAVTNPYNTGYYSGPEMDPVEAVTACPNIFGSGSLPGYIGKYHIAPKNAGCFNAHGTKGRKYLLPAIWNPETKSCWTLM